jgi:hypothetical protein
MAGTKEWEVNITFFVEADNDDDALRKATKTLRYGEIDVTWAWIYTTQTKERHATS